MTTIRFILNVQSTMPSTSRVINACFIITSSKDTFVKLWDLSTQHCIQTIVAHRAEVWTLDINPEQNLVFTGSSEGEMKIWKIDHEALQEGLKETLSGEVGIFQLYRTHMNLYHPHLFTVGSEGHPCSHNHTSCVATSCHPDLFPPHPSLSCCPIS